MNVLFTCNNRPVTEHGTLMRMLRAPRRFVFYSLPVEQDCLWFQANSRNFDGPRASALRPSEFMSILSKLVISEGASYECRWEISDRRAYSRSFDR